MAMALGGGSDRKITPVLNVAPLVDVVLVLLIIFMVLAPMMTKTFWVHLPPKDEIDQKLDAANDPQRPLILRVAADGSIAVNTVVVGRDELPERLVRMFNARPDNTLYVDAADTASYGNVVSALDLARAGRALNIVVLTKELGG